ncbi:MAG: hypothetical protein HOV66_07650 [Streptomycetaceae bacterium]|nr:hypothetical protein [Streptomycetaceae bacterium]
MTWNLQDPIPTDAARVLVTTPGGVCALYEDGAFVSLGDPTYASSNCVDLSPVVRHLLGLAGVTLVEGVDRRLIVADETDTGPVRRQSLTDVEATRAALAKAAQLREQAAAALAEAEQMEGQR